MEKLYVDIALVGIRFYTKTYCPKIEMGIKRNVSTNV